MAEARTEEEEENMRDTREQVVRRQPNSSGGQTSGSVKTPDDCSRIPPQPITAPLPGCSLPITTLAIAGGRSSRPDRRKPEHRHRLAGSLVCD
ncbi:hypothetical protein PAMP_015997 [Pampus punctatissimus]